MKSEKGHPPGPMAMLAAVACVVALIHFRCFPPRVLFEFDMADVPVLIGALLLRLGSGTVSFCWSSRLVGPLYGGNGWVGLVMHFVASGAMVVIVGQFYRWRHKYKDMAVGMGARHGLPGGGHDPDEPDLHGELFRRPETNGARLDAAGGSSLQPHSGGGQLYPLRPSSSACFCPFSEKQEHRPPCVISVGFCRKIRFLPLRREESVLS